MITLSHDFLRQLITSGIPRRFSPTRPPVCSGSSLRPLPICIRAPQAGAARRVRSADRETDGYPGGSHRLRRSHRGARRAAGADRHGGDGALLEELFAVLTAAGHEVALAEPVRRPALPGGEPRAHQDRRDRCRGARAARLREAPRADPAPRRGRREPARARQQPRLAAPGLRRPGAPAAPAGRGIDARSRR